MSVKKFKIPIRDIGLSGTSIDLNVNLDFSPMDNAELIQTKLIDDEREKSINPIVDYKKVRFFPSNQIKLSNMVYLLSKTTLSNCK